MPHPEFLPRGSTAEDVEGLVGAAFGRSIPWGTWPKVERGQITSASNIRKKWCGRGEVQPRGMSENVGEAVRPPRDAAPWEGAASPFMSSSLWYMMQASGAAHKCRPGMIPSESTAPPVPMGICLDVEVSFARIPVSPFKQAGRRVHIIMVAVEAVYCSSRASNGVCVESYPRQVHDPAMWGLLFQCLQERYQVSLIKTHRHAAA